MRFLIRKQLPAVLLCLSLAMHLYFLNPSIVYAAPAPWPECRSISAEGGILMDANSGAVLYGKNIHEPYFPASITKILTALIVIENCNLDDVVTFSHSAVYDVEEGSTNANMEEGDRMTVRDCLYAMMLKSANEVSNALAEHVATSIPAFSAMMNAKALSLGCTDSHFNNPSGLNDPDHYTSAYDMALIAQAAFQNETFARIASTLYYDLPPTKRNPEGLRIYPGHQMLKKNLSNFYPGVIGGKTGYTSLAGNTLVTCAQRGNLRLVTVVLNGHQTHYADTRTMLNFGFRNFRSLDISDLDTSYTSIENDMTIAGLPTTDLSVLHIQEGRKITLPINSEFADVTSSISYDISPGMPEGAIAQIKYDYDGRMVGFTHLIVNEQKEKEVELIAEVPTSLSQTEELEFEENTDSPKVVSQPSSDQETTIDGHKGGISLHIPTSAWIVLAVLTALAIIAGGTTLLKLYVENRKSERVIRYRRRQQRLRDMGISSDEFDRLLQQRRRGRTSPSHTARRYSPSVKKRKRRR